jgi:hypothetical protein
VLRLLIRRRSSEFANDVELLVLRHQLVVLGGNSDARRCAQPIAPSLPR